MAHDEKGCTACGIARPRWHGGKHDCIQAGERYYLGVAGSRHVTDSELSFLRTPGPVQ